MSSILLIYLQEIPASRECSAEGNSIHFLDELDFLDSF